MSSDHPIIKHANNGDQFAAGDDGFWYWWPAPVVGCLNESALRALADELERRNRPWVQKIDDYFERTGGSR